MSVDDLEKRMMEEYEARRTSMGASLTLAAGSSPEEVARRKRVASLLGVPVAVVEGDPDAADTKALVATVEKNTEGAPALQGRYTDADFAKLAHDQSEPMGMVERIARNLAAGYGGDFVGSGIAGLGHTARSLHRMLLDASAAQLRLEGTAVSPDALRQAKEDVLTGESLLSLGQQTKDYWRGVAPKEQSFADQVARGRGQMALQLPVAFAAPWVGVSMMYGQGADIMAEKIATDKAAQKTELLNQDLEILSGGAITAATEWASSKLLLSPPQCLQLRSKLLARTLGVASGGAGEGVQEMLENIGQDLSHIALSNPDSSVAWAEAVRSGGVGAIVGTVASSVIQGALHVRTRRMQQIFDDLSEATRAQQVRDRDPGTYHGFADAVARHLAGTTDGAVENVYIDAGVLHQTLMDNKINPDEVAAAVGSIGEQLDEARATGGDVVIPLGEFIGKVVGTDVGDLLMPHLRSAPEGLSIAEVEAAAKMAPKLQEQAEEILSSSEKHKAWQKSANEVQGIIFEQLKQRGVRPQRGPGVLGLRTGFLRHPGGSSRGDAQGVLRRPPLPDCVGGRSAAGRDAGRARRFCR
jgi:hypothetical protein